MWDGAEAAKVSVPPQGVFERLIHSRIQHIEAFLALTTSDDFTNAGSQHIHRCHGALIIVKTHVERLDLARVIGHYHRGLISQAFQ